MDRIVTKWTYSIILSADNDEIRSCGYAGIQYSVDEQAAMKMAAYFLGV